MTFKPKPLAEQVIVITGASSGIGLVTARRASRAGAKVMLVARSGDVLAQLAEEIRQAGGEADHRATDVGDPAQVEAAAQQAVQRFGRIDGWVNDAGVAIYARLIETPEDEHQQLFRTNYFGMVHGCLAAVRHLREAGGAIVTVGSIASDIPSPIMGAYAASKHAVKAYTEILRIELAKAGLPIAVSLIKPSGIDTPIARHAAVHAEGRALLPPPVYDPELVADAILHCLVHPKRALTVGGGGRLQVLLTEHFKGLFEKLAPADPSDMTDKDMPQPTPSNLFEGVRAGDERSGEQPGRRFSLYTTAARHPRTTAALGVGALIGSATLLLFQGARPKK